MQVSSCLDNGPAARVLDRNVDLFDGSNKASAYPVTCTYLYREGVLWQGLQPCTCFKPRQRQRQKLAFRGMAGWVRLRGTP
ncbi:hypothetical protein C1925_10060 [Stenotrophomonas sp. SAU14A_NAIMI4_5]|nr:hypothetical protein C1925_10060 [Stenotrophomonas sp. SAU14A_NAIMI4_5]